MVAVPVRPADQGQNVGLVRGQARQQLRRRIGGGLPEQRGTAGPDPQLHAGGAGAGQQSDGDGQRAPPWLTGREIICAAGVPIPLSDRPYRPPTAFSAILADGSADGIPPEWPLLSAKPSAGTVRFSHASCGSARFADGSDGSGRDKARSVQVNYFAVLDSFQRAADRVSLRLSSQLASNPFSFMRR